MVEKPYPITLRNVLLLAIWAGIFFILFMPLIVGAWDPAIGQVKHDNIVEAFGHNVFQRIFSGGGQTYFPYVVGKALYARTIIEVIFGLWLVLIFRFPEYRLGRSRVMIAFAAFLGANLIAALAGVSFTRSFWSTYERMQGVVDMLHWFGFTMVVATVVRSFKHWRYLLHANLVIVLLVALIGVAQNSGLKFTSYLLFNVRVDSTLGNPVYLGAVMMVNALIAGGLFAASFEERLLPKRAEGRGTSKRRRKAQQAFREEGLQQWSRIAWRVFYLVCAALFVWVLVLAGARGALFGLVGGFITLTVIYLVWGRNVRFRLAGVGVIATLGILAILLAVGINSAAVKKLAESNAMMRQFTNLAEQDYSVSGRWISIQMGLRGFAAKPVAGWGPENFAVAYDRYVPASAFTRNVQSYDQAHSRPIEVLTTTGIVGFIPWLAFWAAIGWVLLKATKKKRAPLQLFVYFMGTAVVGYFVQNLFLFNTAATVLQLYLLVAFVVSLETILHKEPAFSDAADEPATDSKAKRQDEGEITPSTKSPGIVDRVREWMDRQDIPAGVELGPVVAIIIVTILLLNARPYVAAQSILRVYQGNITWEQRLRNFEISIDAFPPLANYFRALEFELFTGTWDLLSVEQRELAVAEIEDEFQKGVRAEPEQWRLYVSGGVFFQTVSAYDERPEYLEMAREQIDRAVELAPQRVEVRRALVQQYIREGDLEEAEQVIKRYVAQNEALENQFLDLTQYIRANRATTSDATVETSTSGGN